MPASSAIDLPQYDCDFRSMPAALDASSGRRPPASIAAGSSGTGESDRRVTIDHPPAGIVVVAATSVTFVSAYSIDQEIGPPNVLVEPYVREPDVSPPL